MSYLATHDDELLTKLGDQLSPRAVRSAIKKILLWVVIFFVAFWIIGSLVSETDWTKFDQAQTQIGGIDNKKDFVRYPFVWILIVVVVIIVFLLVKLETFTNKNARHDLESWNWLFLIFALIVLFCGWWILCATKTMTGEVLSDLGSLMVSLWFAVNTFTRVKATFTLGTDTALTFSIIFYPIIFIVLLLFVIKGYWGLVITVIVILLIIWICVGEVYVYLKKPQAGNWLTIIFAILLIGVFFWMLSLIVWHSAFPLFWYVIIFVVIFLFFFYLKKNPVEE
ncbi:hypothetical protein P9112_009665 [Eukaryota sp. TZLM1-RC]